MNVSLEKIDAVNAKLTVKLEKADYAEEVEKSLKKLKKRVNMPGFRPGNVPMGIIKRMYGNETKADEVNKKLSEAVSNYIKEQKLRLLTDPLISENQKQQDIVNGDDYEFTFDLGLAPEFDIELNKKDKIDYYDINIDDKTVDTAVDNYRRQRGEYVNVEAYEEENDLVRGTLTELDEKGEVKDGGLVVEKASIMPRFFTNEEQKEIFKKEAKPNADLVFNPSKAYDGKDIDVSSLLKIKKEEVSQHQGDFKLHIESISRFKMGEINQDLFDFAFGKGTVKNEEEFRAHIKEDIAKSYVRDSDYKFLIDVRDYASKKVGELQFPTEILKRFLLQNIKKEEDKQNIDNILSDYIKELKWSLIRTALADKLKIKVDDEAVKETAREMVRIQFAQYGLNNVPAEQVENYAGEMLKNEQQQENIINRSIDRELTKALKETVKLNKKAISIEDFNKMFEEKAA